MSLDIALLPAERHAELVGPLLRSFGLRPNPERNERMQRFDDLWQRIGAFDGDAIVGSAGAFRFDLSTPGGEVRTSGLTMVGVLPTHRRRGVLTSLVRRHLEESHAAGYPVSALWASEGQIYGRFGYGIATMACSTALPRSRSSFRRACPQPGRLRLVSAEEARATFPSVHGQIRAITPGMPSRSPLWWEWRRLADYDKSNGPLEYVLLEVDGKPEGYALYRLTPAPPPPGVLDLSMYVYEAMATSPRGTYQLWRYLFDMDLASTIHAMGLPVSHPLFHLIEDPARLEMTLSDGMWLRLTDAEQALNLRAWPSHETLTFALHDAFCPWNSGVYRIAEGRVTRAHASPDLKMDAQTLGSLYLGGFSARRLADAGDLDELVPGAIDRADTLFRSAREPWCPEVF